MTTDFQQPGNLGDVNSNEPGSGARYNAGKPAFELVPLIAFEGCARVFDFGRAKYAPWNWAKGMAWSAPFGCLMRHLSAWQRGEDTDPESGLPHLDHAMANLVMLTTYARTYPQGDDRTEWLRSHGSDQLKPIVDPDVMHALFASKRERWAKAPPWAKALTEDGSGHCEWWELTPVFSRGIWCVQQAGAFMSRPAGHRMLGTVLCELRPELAAVGAGCLTGQLDAAAQQIEQAKYEVMQEHQRMIQRWRGAPLEADWLTQDKHGECHWWSGSKPREDFGLWSATPNCRVIRQAKDRTLAFRGNVLVVCEKRPPDQPCEPE